MKYDGYHTALAQPYHRVGRASVAYGRHGVAMEYDIFSRDIPAEFHACDVIYADLPWRSGFDTFEERAGKSGRNYNDFLGAVRWHVEALGLPTVLVTGKHALAALGPDRSYPTKLNGAPAMAMCWGIDLNEHGTEREILGDLANRFSVLGDYCCGYGRTARYAIASGKRYVISDMNEQCIAYIGDKL